MVMGFWEKVKSAISSSLDYIEGKAHTSNYVLHPDHAYLGQKYYCKESKLPPRTVRSLDSMGPSGADAGSGLPPAATPHTSRTTSSLVSKEQERAMKRVQPHVRISAKSVPTPLRMPEDRYVVMRHRDLINDDKVDVTVDRDRNLYWAIKAAVVLIIKECSEAQIVANPPRSLSADSERLQSTIGDNGQEDVTMEKTPINQNIGGKIGSMKTSQALLWSVEGFGDAKIVSSMASEVKKKNPAPSVKTGAKARDLLESRSVEGKSCSLIDIPNDLLTPHSQTFSQTPPER